MNYKSFFIIAFLPLFTPCIAKAQKPFVEGEIVYKVTLNPPGSDKSYAGTYTVTVKGKNVKKELKMENGYDDVIIFKEGDQIVYSLKEASGKKYAIQLDFNDYLNRERKYNGFSIKEYGKEEDVNGISVKKALITYLDGKSEDIYYNTEWYPVDATMYNRFPNIKVLPVQYEYTDDSGMIMNFKAEKISPVPIENAAFRIPTDYKIITYSEYKQMNK